MRNLIKLSGGFTGYKFWFGFVMVVLLSGLAGRYLLMPGYFDMHDDLQVTRQYEMNRCFDDGQIPCRWSPDLGNGYGFPMFNFYSPMPNYIGMFFVWTGWSYVDTVKILFLIGLVGSGLGMYWLVWLLTSDLYAGLLSSALYVWAPYHALDVFVRGAMAESWSLMWMPLILAGIWLQFKSVKRFNLVLIISLLGLFLSHNIMSMWFTPVLLGWIVFLLFFQKVLSIKIDRDEPLFDWVTTAFTRSRLLWLGLNILMALGLGAFFLLPAILEKQYIHSDTLVSDYYNFRLHFVSWRQLFTDLNWGFGASRPGLDDGISFQIGFWNWGIIIVEFFLILVLAFVKKVSLPKSKFRFLVSFAGFWLMVGLMAIYMTHAKSVRVWEMFPFLAWTQFPWRVLALVILGLSITAGLLLSVLTKFWKRKLSVLVILGMMIMYWNYFIPKGYNPSFVDDDRLKGQAWVVQQKGALLDYLPKTVKTYEVVYPKTPVRIFDVDKSAVAEWKNWRSRSNEFSFDLEINNDEDVGVQVSVFDFPGWVVYVDDVPTSVDNSNKLGLIEVRVTGAGKHFIHGKFKNTSTRSIANLITIFTYLLITGWIFYPKKG